MNPGHAQVVGTGLIGASIGMALRRAGWHVTGHDRDPRACERAHELGALDVRGQDPDPAITFVATPVGAVPAEVLRALSSGTGLVTDTGSVKGPMVDLMADPRFVGGHPMAGSEREGPDGARADLFEGATWVLTPVHSTDDAAFAQIRSVVSSFGAEVLSIPPERHDTMVAVVSHVPHLTAATLMDLAEERSAEHAALLRLAAGGFRDMTRIAAGHPGIWPDICAENRDAIVSTFDALVERLSEVRAMVATGDSDALVERLERARAARTALPSRLSRTEALAEVRVPIPDRKGELARVLTRAAELDVSVADVEIAHSAERQEGLLILLVETEAGDRLAEGLAALGYHPSVHRLDLPAATGASPWPNHAQ